MEEVQDVADEVKSIDWDLWMDKGIELATEYGLKILAALAIWVIGGWIFKRIYRLADRMMAKMHYEESLRKFLGNLVKWGLKILLIIVILGVLGIETTSFAAILAAAGLAVGLALQGSLSNFAGGVLIMIFKPIKIGDFIEAQGEKGTVKEIQIFVTKLLTPQNKTVIIPNGALSNGNITNYSSEGTLWIFMTIGVSYDADIKQTRDVLMNILTNHPKVLKDPPPMVEVAELADSSVNFTVRPWVNLEDYWSVYFDVTTQAKLDLDAAGIEIPFPQRVVHMANPPA